MSHVTPSMPRSPLLPRRRVPPAGGGGRQVVCWAIYLLALLLAMAPKSGQAQDAPAKPASVPGISTGYADFKESIERSLASEKEAVKTLQAQNKELAPDNSATEAALNAYSLQLSAHGNLLLTSNVPLSDLERAISLNTTTIAGIESRIKVLRAASETSQSELANTIDHLRLNAEQMQVLASDNQPDATVKTALQNLQRLNQVLSSKRDLLTAIVKNQEALFNQFLGLRDSFAGMNERLAKAEAMRKKEALFARGLAPWAHFSPARLADDMRRAKDSGIEFVLGRVKDGNRAETLGQSLLWFLVVAAMLAAGLWMLRRWRHPIQQIEETCRQNRFRCALMRLLRDSLPWLGSWLFMAALHKVEFIPSGQVAAALRLGLALVSVQLCYRWAQEALALAHELVPQSLTAPWRAQLARALRIAYGMGLAHVLALALFEAGSALPLILRLGFGAWALIWGLRLRRLLPDGGAQTIKALASWATLRAWLAIAFAVAVPLVAMVLDLLGYANLARHWYGAWAFTAALLFWGALFGAVLWELERPAATQEQTATAQESGESPLRWLMLRATELALLLVMLSALIRIWGGVPNVWKGVLSLLRYPIPLGEMHFSLLSLLHAGVVVLVTTATARLWRYLLRYRLRWIKGLEAGFKESVIALTTYIVWGVGILVTLRTIGLNATSMAVAFGALGVGLGFGLQAIFNNFISGLILLFERPIQVGDAVEVDGVWGVVKKIEVRSTLVQTYDNATLIIPNSEFISKQVKNWSFKDPRLRRAVTVGVAYGSDVEKVRQALLEIAASTPNVLSFPPPAVVFSDFGDSALIFILRFWTTIDHTPAVDSAIRYAIDRRFRELGIEIPFPQQEIRVRPDQVPAAINSTAPEAQ